MPVSRKQENKLRAACCDTITITASQNDEEVVRPSKPAAAAGPPALPEALNRRQRQPPPSTQAGRANTGSRQPQQQHGASRGPDAAQRARMPPPPAPAPAPQWRPGPSGPPAGGSGMVTPRRDQRMKFGTGSMADSAIPSCPPQVRGHLREQLATFPNVDPTVRPTAAHAARHAAHHAAHHAAANQFVCATAIGPPSSLPLGPRSPLHC